MATFMPLIMSTDLQAPSISSNRCFRPRTTRAHFLTLTNFNCRTSQDCTTLKASRKRCRSEWSDVHSAPPESAGKSSDQFIVQGISSLSKFKRRKQCYEESDNTLSNFSFRLSKQNETWEYTPVIHQGCDPQPKENLFLKMWKSVDTEDKKDDMNFVEEAHRLDKLTTQQMINDILKREHEHKEDQKN